MDHFISKILLPVYCSRLHLPKVKPCTKSSWEWKSLPYGREPETHHLGHWQRGTYHDYWIPSCTKVCWNLLTLSGLSTLCHLGYWRPLYSSHVRIFLALISTFGLIQTYTSSGRYSTKSGYRSLNDSKRRLLRQCSYSSTVYITEGGSEHHMALRPSWTYRNFHLGNAPRESLSCQDRPSWAFCAVTRMKLWNTFFCKCPLSQLTSGLGQTVFFLSLPWPFPTFFVFRIEWWTGSTPSSLSSGHSGNTESSLRDSDTDFVQGPPSLAMAFD